MQETYERKQTDPTVTVCHKTRTTQTCTRSESRVATRSVHRETGIGKLDANTCKMHLMPSKKPWTLSARARSTRAADLAQDSMQVADEKLQATDIIDVQHNQEVADKSRKMSYQDMSDEHEHRSTPAKLRIPRNESSPSRCMQLQQ